MKSRPLFIVFAIAACFLVLSLQTARAQKPLVAVKMIPPGCKNYSVLPDLMIVSSQVTTADQYVVEIKNDGQCPAGASTLGIYYHSKKGVQTKTSYKEVKTLSVTRFPIPALAAGSTYTYRQILTGVYEAVYQLGDVVVFKVDDRNVIREGNEYNNSSTVSR